MTVRRWLKQSSANGLS
ncbi:hypothetical protein QUA79_33825 [Microcoleus sp. F8-D1]